MTNEHRIILKAIEDTLNRDPELRFGQALFNLDIYGFVNSDTPTQPEYKLRDIHGDKDVDIIERINARNEWLEIQDKVNKGLERTLLKEIKGMSFSERLFSTGLKEDFEKYKNSNKKFARFILERLLVDDNLINEILN
jgi:hypothetical protein